MRRRMALGVTVALAWAVAGCGDDPTQGELVVPTPTAADPSVAPADFVEVGIQPEPDLLEELGFSVEPPPEGGELFGPHYALGLGGYAVTGELTAAQLDALSLRHATGEPVLRAGPDREFLLVPLAEPESSPPAQTGGEPTVAVMVDGEPRPEHPLLHFINGSLPAELVLVVSVPVGGDALLVVGDAGQNRPISLRTGGVPSGSDNAADHLRGGTVHLEEGIRIGGGTPPDGEALTISVAVQPESYVDDGGWAPEGRIWLNIELTVGLVRCEQCAAERGVLALDLAESLTVRTDDGTDLPLPDGVVLEPAALNPDLAQITWAGPVPAPDSIGSVEVSWATTGTFTMEGGGSAAIERFGGTTTATLDLTAG